MAHTFTQAEIEQIKANRLKLAARQVNTPYRVLLYNADGTRYFYAVRCQKSWYDNRGNYMPYGGGSYWTVAYGMVQVAGRRNPVGEIDWELTEGKRFGRSANGTEIPAQVSTKAQAVEIAKKIGVFNI